jgi:osmoprotectant transport system permease protein
VSALEKLAGTLGTTRMTRLNAEAERTKNYALAAALYFGQKPERVANELAGNIGRWTCQHLKLVGASLLLAIMVGIPLGIRASRPGPISDFILGAIGMIQTIPSLALLALLVPLPFFGISPVTAIFALFLYSLLPIVRNTATGLQEIPAAVRESAAGLGLEPNAQLWKVFLPLASRTILAGIKTSAIIDVGAATVAALIGAGGLGEPIISGLNLNDSKTILEGAIPAALLALLVQFFFDGLDRVLVPKGLRLKQ